MTAQPYFSVVIAAFNAARWIVPTVRSALGQTYRAYEIIVIGDGCTDDTGAVLASHFGESIRWTSLERNSGAQSFPNNEGIRLANGTHVAYLGHDDIWSPRHLEALAGIIRAEDSDFAVSGVVYHGPPGSRHYQITGLFDDASAAATQFFPPSSFAHRREVVGRIGLWRDPNALRAPADADFLLRAVAERCTFASTRTITVHKFAAGHRYLSYRFASGLEQQRMLECLSVPGGEAQVLSEIANELAHGADHPPVLHYDLENYGAGDLFRSNRRNKGLEVTAPVELDGPCRFPVDAHSAGLDWHPLEVVPRVGPYRWSGPNPNPLHLVNVRSKGAVRLRVHVLAFARDELAQALAIDVDGREAAFARERKPDGTHVFTIDGVAGPVTEGIVLRFRLPCCRRLRGDPARRRAGLALAGVEVVPVP